MSESVSERAMAAALPCKFYTLDEDRHVIEADVTAWGKMFDSEDRIVDVTWLDDCHVSTVFLGIDHRHSGAGPPLLFETIIFGGPLDRYMWRYASWDDAVVGHRAAVRKAREAVT